jgi:hypothetical protein
VGGENRAPNRTDSGNKTGRLLPSSAMVDLGHPVCDASGMNGRKGREDKEGGGAMMRDESMA